MIISYIASLLEAHANGKYKANITDYKGLNITHIFAQFAKNMCGLS